MSNPRPKHAVPVNTAVKPNPGQNLLPVLQRLKNNDDFKKFFDFIADRGTMLAYLTCDPAISDKSQTQMQGRVQEIVDIRALFDNLDAIAEEYEKSKTHSMGATV